MPVIQHKFNIHIVNSQIQILILGTFNPDVPNGPDFFYGRPRNFLWHLLPQCWGLDPLKAATLPEKQAFMNEYKIDFADLIQSLDVPTGKESNVDDDFIDSHVQHWKDIISLINNLPELKEVYFTRKTFNGIPNIRAQVKLIADHCTTNKIRFCKLETPARFYNPEKQQQWIDTLSLKTSCLKP